MTVCVSGNEQNQVEMKGYQVLPLSSPFSARFVN